MDEKRKVDVMHKFCCNLAALLVLGAPLALLGQTPNEDGLAPASSNIRGAEYPKVSLNGRAEFRLKAPNAKSVLLIVGDGMNKGTNKGPFPMTKDQDGVWSVTLSDVVVGFHYYAFDVDGLFVNDPGSETFEGFFKPSSGIEVPEKDVTYDQIKDVPQGTLEPHYYFSKTTGKWRRCFVYTPVGYDSNPTARYPVLYLQHGSSETEESWGKQGRVNIIMNNLIAEGKAKPMIVVMDLGYAQIADNSAPAVAGFTQAYSAFEQVVINDLIPNIDANFRTIADREHRAMAGLSMGGMQTLVTTLDHQDKFAWIGSFSAPMIGTFSTSRPATPANTTHPLTLSPPPAFGAILEQNTTGVPRSPQAPFDVKTAYNGAFADPAAFNQRIHLLWFGAGTTESFYAPIKAGVDALQAAGIHVSYYESPGTAHEWLTWRRHLNEFAPLLFR
jgi:enterochelin esterase-like enzyme